MAVVTAVLGTVDSLRDRIESEDPVLLNSEERASAHLVGRSVGAVLCASRSRAAPR